MLSPLIKEAVKDASGHDTKSTRIKHKSVHEPAPSMEDPTQFHQIVMNLVTNAFHAVQENNKVARLSPSPEESRFDLNNPQRSRPTHNPVITLSCR